MGIEGEVVEDELGRGNEKKKQSVRTGGDWTVSMYFSRAERPWVCEMLVYREVINSHYRGVKKGGS
jgi:hypothetical protein